MSFCIFKVVAFLLLKVWSEAQEAGGSRGKCLSNFEQGWL